MWPEFQCFKWELNAQITENEGHGFRFFFWPEVAEEMLVQASLLMREREQGCMSRGGAGLTTGTMGVWGREVFWIDLI